MNIDKLKLLYGDSLKEVGKCYILKEDDNSHLYFNDRHIEMLGHMHNYYDNDNVVICDGVRKADSKRMCINTTLCEFIDGYTSIEIADKAIFTIVDRRIVIYNKDMVMLNDIELKEKLKPLLIRWSLEKGSDEDEGGCYIQIKVEGSRYSYKDIELVYNYNSNTVETIRDVGYEQPIKFIDRKLA